MGNNTLKLIEIPYSSFLKIELPRFALRMIEIVEEHDPEGLKIEEIYNLLVAEKPRISNLKDKYGPHPLTGELSDLREMRTLYISEIRNHLKVVTKEDKSGVNTDVKNARIAINHFLSNLDLSKNEEMFNQKITQFLEVIAKEEEVSRAIGNLDFLPKITQLSTIHSSIQTLIGAKLRSISARPKETTAQLVKAVLSATKNLLKDIELAPLKHPDLDYVPLYKDLNQLLIDYRDIINRRVLFNKRKAAKKENGESTETTTTIQLNESEEKMILLNTEEMNANGLESQPVETRKAVAVSSKTMQLPSITGNEA